MVSAEDKRHNEHRRIRRIVGATLVVSLFLHGGLWAIARQIPAPVFQDNALFEVALTPLKKKKPDLSEHASTKQIPVQPQTPTWQQSPRRVRLAALPRVQRRIQAQRQKQPRQPRRQFPSLHKPQRQQPTGANPSQNSAQSSSQLNPLRAATLPVRLKGASPTTNLNALRSPGHSREFASSRPTVSPYSLKAAQDNEVAGFADDTPQNPTTGNRRGRRRSRDTQVYLPDGNSSGGSSGDSSPNGATSPISVRPGFNDRGHTERSDHSRYNSVNRLAGGSEKRSGPRVPHPEKKLQPTARGEEASDSIPNGNQTLRPRLARRQNRSDDDPIIFPTPRPPEIAPEPQSKPAPELFHPARLRAAPKPAYPADAKANNQEGTVVVRLQISESGHVTDASLVSSSGVASLDAASLKGVRRWTYEPARRGKTFVSSSLTARLRWRLTD